MEFKNTWGIIIEEAHYTAEHGVEHVVVQVAGWRHANLEEHVSPRGDEEDAAYYECRVHVQILGCVQRADVGMNVQI